MTYLPCRLCQSEMDSGVVCQTCVGGMMADLRALWATGDLHGFDTDLDITIAKMDVFARSGGGGKPSEAPMLIRDEASETRRYLHGMLATWCRVMMEPFPALPGPTCRTCDHRSCQAIRYVRGPQDTIASMAKWLHARSRDVRTAEWGDECVEQIRYAVSEVRKCIERPAERIYAGPCPDCGGKVYGLAGAAKAWCRQDGCDGEIEDPEARRDEAVKRAVAAAPERLVTAAEAAMASRALGRQVSDRAVRKMAAEGKIHAVPGSKPAKYRLGEIMDVLHRKERATA
ncbi:hypothetical protein [Bacillus mobilis]